MNKLIPKIAVNIFVIINNKLLLGKRKNASGDADWGLPGGHLEFGEHLLDGAKRELKEETGFKVKNLSLLNIVNDSKSKDRTHYLNVNFIAKNLKGEPKLMEPSKCYGWKWFALNDLPKNIFLGHRKSIKAFLEKVYFAD